MPQLSLPNEERTRLWDDGIHPTPEGYDQVGKLIYDFLSEFL